MSDAPMPERWLPVVGFEGLYEVSDLGKVRSLAREVVRRDGQRQPIRGRELVRKPGYGGYVLAELWRENRVHKVRVHTLVLTAFRGPRPEGMEGLHGLGGPSDNRLVNLRWGTSSENKYDVVRDGNHHRASSPTCIRDHLLEGSNLKVYRYKGRENRQCRACARAHDKVRYEATQGRHADVDKLADQFYLEYVFAEEETS